MPMTKQEIIQQLPTSVPNLNNNNADRYKGQERTAKRLYGDAATLLTQRVATRILNKTVYAIWGQGWRDGNREKNVRRLMVVHAPEIEEHDAQSWSARVRMEGEGEWDLSYDDSDDRVPIVTGSGSDPIFVFLG